MRFIYSFLITLFFSSCVLQEEEKNYNEVSKDPDPRYKTSIVYSYDDRAYSPIKDSVWLTNQTYFQLLHGNLYEVEVLVDGKSILSQQGNKFSLQASKFSKGLHSLQIIQRVKSGTGSLADKLRAEYAEYVSNYVLSTVASTYTPIITSVSYFNGSAKITWNPYTHGDFQSYQIEKVSEGAIRNIYQDYTITDPLQTSLIDTTYVGGAVYYQLTLNNGGTIASSKYNFSSNYYAKPLLMVVNGAFNLSWVPPTAYNDVKDYTVYLNRVKYDHINATQLSIDFNSSSLLIGGLYECEILANARGGTDLTYSYYPGIPAGKKIPYFTDVKHDTQKSSYYVYAPYQFYYTSVGEALYQLDDTNFTVIDSLATPLGEDDGRIVVSSNGQYHYLLGTNWLMRFDPDNLSKLEKLRYDDLVPGSRISFKSDNGAHGITDNNFLFYLDGGSSYSYVVDMNTKKLVSKISGITHLSPDGQYLATYTSLYSFSTNTYVKTASIPYTNINFMEFLNKNPSQLLIATTTNLIIYNCATQLEVFSYPFTNSGVTGVHRIDQASNKVFLSSLTSKIVFDLTTKTPYTLVKTDYPTLLEGDALFFNAPSYPPYGGWVQKKY